MSEKNGEAHLVWDNTLGDYMPANQRKSKQRFVKGPIPLPWLNQAAQLPGKTLHVGMAIWYVRGLKKVDTFSITKKTATVFGLTRQALARGLNQLEHAGLISVESYPGRSKVVTLKKSQLSHTG